MSKAYFELGNSHGKTGMEKTVMCFQDNFFSWKILFPMWLSWLLGGGRRKKSWCRTNINIFFRSVYGEFHIIWILFWNILRAIFLVAGLWLRFLSQRATSCIFRSDASVRSGIKSRKSEPQRDPETLWREQYSTSPFTLSYSHDIYFSEHRKNKMSCVNLNIQMP